MQQRVYLLIGVNELGTQSRVRVYIIYAYSLEAITIYQHLLCNLYFLLVSHSKRDAMKDEKTHHGAVDRNNRFMVACRYPLL